MYVEDEKSIYDLKLNEGIKVNICGYDFIVIRVPGGWVYYINSSNGCISTFVPYDKEFKKTTNELLNENTH